MRVDVTHLIPKAERDTDDEIVDYSLHGAEGGDALAGAVMKFDIYDIAGGVREGDCQMGHVFH